MTKKKKDAPIPPLLQWLSSLYLLVCLTAFASATEAKQKKPTAIPLPSDQRWTGDLPGMIERRQIRILVVYNKMFYFLDGGAQRGGTYEMGKLFEKELNRKHKTKALKVNVIFIPVARDEIIDALEQGRGDIAAANLTITPKRLRKVDFSDPFLTETREVVIAGANGPKIESIDDLAGKIVYTQPTTSYEESLKALNARFKAEDKPPMLLVPVGPHMEDSDLLEMANAGLIPLIIVDLHKALFWKDIFPHIRVYEDVAVRTGGEIAWAIRKHNPKLKKALDEFVAGHKMGTLHGNVLFKRYLRKNKWVRNNLTDKDLKKFKDVVNLFRKYAGRYDFDALMVTALAYQESRLDHSKRSARGAIGIMQLLPSTAKDPNIDIPDIHLLEPNIHAGTKYLRFLYDRYFADEPMTELDKMLFSFASYNAGPAKVRRLRDAAGELGLDPQRWFHHVEVATAKLVGAETVQYVANIYKYYTAYRLLTDQIGGNAIAGHKP